MATSQASASSLNATYASLTDARAFKQALPHLSSSEQLQSIDEKTAYLSALRISVKEMQGAINTFLTQKMEDDKASGASAADGRQKKDDAKAEEMYGEEEAADDG